MRCATDCGERLGEADAVDLDGYPAHRDCAEQWNDVRYARQEAACTGGGCCDTCAGSWSR